MSPAEIMFKRAEYLRGAIQALLDSAEFAAQCRPKDGERIDPTCYRQQIEQLATPEIPVLVVSPEVWSLRLRRAADDVYRYVMARSGKPRSEDTDKRHAASGKGGDTKPDEALEFLRECEDALLAIPDEFYGNPALVRMIRKMRRPLARKPKRRRKAGPRIRPLTKKERDAVERVSEHKGNVTAAAKAAGKSRQAMSKLYRKAMKKLEPYRAKAPKAQALPTDNRGQADLPDRTGQQPPKGRVNRKPLRRDG